ncbi:15609_t:CDS:1, partial [Gigaspora rosea]
MTKTVRTTTVLTLPGKLKFDQDLTKLFPKIADTLWDLHQSIRVPRSIKVQITMNKNNGENHNQIATLTIEDTLYTLSIITKTWPSILKTALNTVITLNIAVPQKSKIIIETNIEPLKRTIDDYINMNIQPTQSIKRHNLPNHIRCIVVILKRKQISLEVRVKKDIAKSAADRYYKTDLKAHELLRDIHVLHMQNEPITYNLKTVVKHTFQAA